jgi:D-hydroxyproline dehydrogenase subunit alpha
MRPAEPAAPGDDVPLPGDVPLHGDVAVDCDVAVVGGGPAGLAAATRLAASGARVVLLEEAAELGGQYFKRRTGAVLARYGDYRPEGTRLIAAARAAAVRCRTGHTVWGVEDDGQTLLAWDCGAGTTVRVRARARIVATGAYERAIPFPGWQLPGVVTPGHALHLASCDRVALGQRVVLAGTGPFLIAAAAAVLRAGGGVAAVIELNTPYRPRLTAARFPSRLRELAGYAATLAAHRVRVLQGQRVVAALGRGRIETVQIAARDGGRTRTIEVDALAVGYGFRPASELVRLLGGDCDRDELGDEFPVTDSFGRTSVPCLYVAGEAARIAGLRAALAAGELAAAAAATDLGLPRPPDQELRAATARLRTELRFAALTAALYPVTAADYAAMPDETLACRCEGVTAGVIRRAAGTGLSDVSGVKAATRAGMGPCQGRQCGVALAVLTAAATGTAPAGIAARMPVKPVPLASLIAPLAGER